MNERKCPFLETRTATLSEAPPAESIPAGRIPSERDLCHTPGVQECALHHKPRRTAREPETVRGFRLEPDYFYHSKHVWVAPSPEDVNPEIRTDPEGARKDPYGKGWVVAVRPSNLARNLAELRIGAAAAAWLDREVRRFSEFLSLHRAVPAEVGVTLPDGGIPADGIVETMDGEILQIAIRKFFR